jgi:hypothetical protein
MNRHIGRRLDAEWHLVAFLAHEGHLDALAGGGCRDDDFAGAAGQYQHGQAPSASLHSSEILGDNQSANGA